MAIDPNNITTVKVGQLPPKNWSLTDLLPHEVLGLLGSGTVQNLGDLMADYIGTVSSLAFNSTLVNDGETLPVTSSKEFMFIGKGTFQNVGGGSDIVTTEPLNVLTSNGTYWELAVEIPIDVELAGIVQTIRAGFTTTTPSEDAVYNALSLKLNISDVPDVSGKEDKVNKQNSLATDGTGFKYPTVDAVNTIGLQKAYSVTPLITTTTPLGALTIKRGSANDTDNVLNIQNGAGTSVTAITGLGNIYTPGVLSENTTTLTPTISGQAARISYINSLKATQPTKLVIYFHGAGDTQNEPFTEPESKYVIDELLSKGYIVAASNAHGNNWGNQASQDDYLALYNYINGLYNISEVIYIGHSMGGLSSLSMLANNTIPKTTAWYGIFPVTNLNEAYFVETGFVASIEAAYGFTGGANYAAATAGYDPQLRTTALYAGRRYTMTASPDDVVIFKTTNADLFNAKLLAGQISSSIITATGNHGNISHFIPKSVSNFIRNAVLNTLNPIGKVNITTGLNGNTTNIATLPINTISFANRGTSTASPTITGKSNDSAGLILIAATNNSSPSADMTFDIRENDDTDYSSINTLGFRFSRFGNSLVEIQRDGKTGFGITTPTTQVDIATGNASVLTDNLTLRSNSQLSGTEVGLFFSPSSAAGNIRGSRISSANDGSNNTDLRFYTGVGASITRKMTIFNTGGVSIGNTTDLGVGTLNVTGNVTTIAATTANHAVIKSQHDSDLALKANLVSPSLTGTPIAPTATAGTNTTQIATTAFVQASIGVGTTYTPTLTNTTNITSSTLTLARYTRVGKLVTAYVALTLSNTVASTASRLKITLPSTAVTSSAFGTGLAYEATVGITQSLIVTSSGSSTQVDVDFVPSAVLNRTLLLSFSYMEP